MPAGRPRDNAKHLNAAVVDLVRAMDRLVGAMSRAPLAAAPAGLAPRAKGKHATRKGNAKLRSVWASYTPAQRAARIAAMRAGHAKRKRALSTGAKRSAAMQLAPRPQPATRVAVVKSAPTVARPKACSGWATLTPDQRAERMAKMRVGQAKAVGASPGAAPSG